MAGHSGARVDVLRGTVADIVDCPGVSEKTMFGCPSFSAEGELFAVVSDQGVSITKLPEEHRAALAESVSVAPFDAGGRRVATWVTVPPESVTTEAITPYLRASYESALAAAGD